MADHLINLFGNICELLIILFFLKNNYRPKYSRTVFVVSCIVFTLLQFANTSLFLGESSFVILGSIIFIFTVTMLYSIKMVYRIIFALFIFILNAMSETIVGMLLASAFDVKISFLQGKPLLFAICTLTSKFLTYFFVLLTKRKWFFNNTNPTKRKVLLVLLLPLSSFLILLVMLRCCYLINETSFHVIMAISSIVLVFSNLAVFFIINEQNDLIETKEKLSFAENHINNQIIHYKELKKYQDELKMFRHDIKNRLLSLSALIRNSDTDKALQLMENNINWLDDSNRMIVNSGNPVIDAIIQSKIHDAKEKNISVEASIKITSPILVDELELGIVLGNALDNAIEAVEKFEHKESIEIYFSIISTEDRISVFIKNPVKENVDTGKLLSDKSNKELHGFGIKSIQTIAQKYDGSACFTCENKIFSANINLINR